MTQVFDLDGTERDLVWLATVYDGCTVLPARVTPGTIEVWRLVAIYVTEGPAALKIEARRGSWPAVDQPVALTWPSLEQPADDLGDLPLFPFNWSPRGVHDRANGDGIWGAGLGSAYGPLYHAWVMSNAPSDCLTGTGMKGGTNHRGPLHGVWVLQPVEVPPQTLSEALIAAGERAQVIQFNPMAALQLRIFAAGMVPNSGEFDVMYHGTSYRCQRAEHLGTGEVRVYYAPLGDWGNVSYVVR